jgi:hypothetical protein
MKRMPETKTELLEWIDREWTSLQQIIAGLTEAELQGRDAGGWSIKDNLAHLAAWEQFMVGHYLEGQPAFVAMGIDEATMNTDDEDIINEMIFLRNRQRAVAEVLADSGLIHAATVVALEATSWDELVRAAFQDDPQARPVLLWVAGNTYEHYAEHAPRIRTHVATLR